MEALTIPDMKRVARIGMIDFDQLNEEDKFQFTLWMNGVMHTYDDGLYQYGLGMLDQNRWELQRRNLRRWFGAPGVVQWWKVTPSTLSPEFVALVSEILDEEPERADG